MEIWEIFLIQWYICCHSNYEMVLQLNNIQFIYDNLYGNKKMLRTNEKWYRCFDISISEQLNNFEFFQQSQISWRYKFSADAHKKYYVFQQQRIVSFQFQFKIQHNSLLWIDFCFLTQIQLSLGHTLIFIRCKIARFCSELNFLTFIFHAFMATKNSCGMHISSDLLHIKSILGILEYTTYLQEKEIQKFNEGIPRHEIKLYL